MRIAIFTALTLVLSLFFVFPIPATNGLVTLCEVGIYTSAFLLSPSAGFWVGALSGGLIDLLSGYAQWIVFSVVIHGIQGWLAGYFFHKNIRFKKTLGLGLGSLFMIVGYFLATALLYGWAAGFASISGNIIQNVVGAAITLLLIPTLDKLDLPSLKEGSK